MEEDYRLFQLVKRNLINSCADLSKNMRGRKNGMLYFTENFRIDFENKMTELGKYQAKSEEDEAVIEEMAKMINNAYYEEDLFWRWFEKNINPTPNCLSDRIINIKEYFRNKAKGE